ncbi:MAG: DNA repair protein RadC [Gammaproteobacteria bacterium]|nr:DNA repair protein RadC [Gammaproteobacteria bacterium]
MTIPQWPEHERPREKLLHKGVKSLSDAELLAILLRTGTQGKSAVDLARGALQQFGSLRKLLTCDRVEFCQIAGLGETKYVQLKACLELGTRYLQEQIQQTDVLSNPCDTYHFLNQRLAHREQEIFACLFLTVKNQVIQYEELFHGTLNHSIVYPRELVKRALKHNAASVIFAHNHPSGDTQPSQADIHLTNTLKVALETIDVKVLDHLIVGGKQVLSFVQQGLL